MDGKERVLRTVLEIIKDMIEDFGIDSPEKLDEETRVVKDLDFESTDIIELFVAIRKHYHCDSIPFQNLVIRNNRFVDFSIGELVEFLYPFVKSNLEKELQ